MTPGEAVSDRSPLVPRPNRGFFCAMIPALLFSHPDADPYWNMAFDEWLLAESRRRPGVLYLRLYTWRTGTITFGYHQRRERALEWSRVNGTPVIRRVTGGRAVFHAQGEPTYAVAGSSDERPQWRAFERLGDTAGTLAEALQRFLEKLGVRADYVRRAPVSERNRVFFHTAPCFASASRYELVSDGRKVVASAQKRIGRAFLQHGAIRLHPIPEHPALGGDPSAYAHGAPRVTLPDWRRVEEAFGRALAETLDLKIHTGELSPAQVAAIARRSEEIARQPLAPRTIL